MGRFDDFLNKAKTVANVAGKKTGEMAVRILRDGEDISKMEIEYDRNYKKVYNKEICDELGVAIPADYEALS